MMRTCFAAVAAVLVIAGCATGSRTQLREVVDGGAGAATPISRIVIVAVASDRSVRAAWEEAFAGRLAARGIAIASGDALPGRATDDAGAASVDGAEVIEAARRAGAQAILFVRPPSDVPIAPGVGVRRWIDARSAPDLRPTFDDAPLSVAEARLFDLRPGAPAWQAYVVTPYPPKGGVDAREAAESVAAGLAKRGYLGGGR